MFRRLRKRFVLVAMLAVFTVLAVIMGGLNIVNYRETVGEADAMLDMLREERGTFRDMEKRFIRRDERRKLRYQSPELPFETRYFTVTLDGSGTPKKVFTERIVAVDSESAVKYSEKAINSGNERGFIDDYRFLRYTDTDGVHLIFLDCGRNLSMFRGFLINSIMLSCAGLLGVLFLILIFSGRALKPVAESYEKQKRFITDAGHEMKTPLTIIDADAELLQMEIEDNEWLKDIRHQTERLTELTGELIFLTRMQEANSSKMIELPLSDLVEETAASFEALAKTQGKTLQISVKPMITMTGDAGELTRLINIMLDNAVKYSPKQAVIRLKLDRTSKQGILTVSNPTEDMSRETLNNLFERFYRADSARTGGKSGYGLGLSIARAIADKHKGRISAANPDGKTLTVTVVLPIKSGGLDMG